MANLIRVVLVSFLFAILYVDPAEADGFDGAFWLIQYEHADQAWNNVAHAYVLGVLDGAGPFGGIRCPPSLSPRTVAAMTADVINTTVSLNEHGAGDRTPGKAGGAPGPTRGVDTSSRWRPARAVQDARGAPRGVKRLGTRGGGRKASGSGGKCASRSAARKAYAAMHSVAGW